MPLVKMPVRGSAGSSARCRIRLLFGSYTAQQTASVRDPTGPRPQSSLVGQRSYPREHFFDQIPRQRFREPAASFLVINRAYLIA